MKMFLVNKYFVKAETGMKKDDVIGGPVYTGPDNDVEVGKIIGYNAKSGFLKIQLNDKINYKHLLASGIPLKNIVFEYTA